MRRMFVFPVALTLWAACSYNWTYNNVQETVEKDEAGKPIEKDSSTPNPVPPIPPDPPACTKAAGSCPGGQFCFFKDKGCGNGASPALCLPIEDPCKNAPEPGPVCGCDGVSYLNACEAATKGNVDVDPTCGGGSKSFTCKGGPDCKVGVEFCRVKDINAPLGSCQPLPEGCKDCASCQLVNEPDCKCEDVQPGEIHVLCTP